MERFYLLGPLAREELGEVAIGYTEDDQDIDSPNPIGPIWMSSERINHAAHEYNSYDS